MHLLLPLGVASIALAAPALSQTTWYVDDDGIPPGSGTVGDPYTSIQYAIDQATTMAGDTLVVLGGTYAEDVHLAGKAIAILGEVASPPRIEGAGVLSAALLAPAGQPAGSLVSDFVIAAHPSGAQRAIELQAGAHLSGVSLVLEGGWDPYQTDSVGGQVRLWATSELALEGCSLQAVDDIQVGGAIAVEQASLTLVGCDLRGALGASQGRGGIVDVSSGGELLAQDSIFRDGFVEDSGDFGGAIALSQSTAAIMGCQFLDAFALQAAGGALYAEDSLVTISGSLFDACGAFQGPGGAILAVGGTLEVEGSEFHGCFALAADGGAVFLDDAVLATFDGCTFAGNVTDGDLAWGIGNGGAVFGNLAAEFRRSLFVGNVADGVPGFAGVNGEGGAIHRAKTVQSCTFFSNRAGTLAEPGTGGAVSQGAVDSSIVWRSFPSAFGPTVTATYSDVQGGWPGTGNMDLEPRFFDIEGGDLALQAGSPCIDAADPALPEDADETPADQGALPYAWLPIGSSYCSANANSSGLPAVITALGSTKLGLGFLRLRARELPADQVGFFLCAETQDFVPFVGGSMGNLCLGGPIQRLDVPPVGGTLFSGPQGRFDLRADLLALPGSLRPQAGETWHFQAWFRDQIGSTSTSNLSDAVSVPFD